MTRAQRGAHRLAWGVLGVLCTALVLWALAQRGASSAPASSSAGDGAASPAGATP